MRLFVQSLESSKGRTARGSTCVCSVGDRRQSCLIQPQIEARETWHYIAGSQTCMPLRPGTSSCRYLVRRRDRQAPKQKPAALQRQVKLHSSSLTSTAQEARCPSGRRAVSHTVASSRTAKSPTAIFRRCISPVCSVDAFRCPIAPSLSCPCG